VDRADGHVNGRLQVLRGRPVTSAFADGGATHAGIVVNWEQCRRWVNFRSPQRSRWPT
jgi:hypothetical protein